MRFFRHCRRIQHDRRSASPEPPTPEPLKGELPHYYDHVVRIGVEVEPQDEAAFLGAVGVQPWQVQKQGQVRYDVRVGVSGAALGSTGAALAKFHRALNRTGVVVQVRFAARLRPQLPPSRRYLVMPRGWMTERGRLAAPVRVLMSWRSRGTIPAASLTEARSRLAGFVKDNPEAGPQDRLAVVGPPDPPVVPEGPAVTEDPLDNWRFLLATALLVCTVGGLAVFGLYTATWRSEGNLFPIAVASWLALPCGFGVWQVLRHIPEGQINTWLPLGLTTLGVPLTVVLSTSNQDAYLEAFGISPGDVVTNGLGRLFALAGFLPALIVLLVALGAFGLLRYFHIGTPGAPFFPRLMAVLAVCLYGLATMFVLLTTMKVPLEAGARVGAEHVAHYRSEGGAPRGHVGVTPSVVCVEPTEDPVNRIGPPLTTDRPVLYFAGADGVDLLWDRDEGLTKVPRFTVSLTPVPELDSPCPAPEPAE